MLTPFPPSTKILLFLRRIRHINLDLISLAKPGLRLDLMGTWRVFGEFESPGFRPPSMKVENLKKTSSPQTMMDFGEPERGIRLTRKGFGF